MAPKAFFHSLLLLASCLVLPVAHSNQNPAPVPTREGKDPPASQNPVDISIEFLKFLETDQSAKAESMMALIAACLSADKLAEAERLIPESRDWRAALTGYQVAAAYGRKGDRVGFERLMAKAGRATSLGATDSQSSRVFRAKAEALAVGGDLDAAKAAVAEISDPYHKAMAHAAMLTHADLNALEPELESVAGLASPEARIKAYLILGRRLAAAGRKEKAVEILRKGLALAEQDNDANTILQSVELVEAFLEAKSEVDAKHTAVLCVSFANRTPADAGWKTRDLGLAAKALEMVGELERAKALRDLMPEVVSKTDIYQFTNFGADVARAFLSPELSDKFDQSLADVIRLGRQHDHHRARAQAVLSAARLCVELGREFPGRAVAEAQKTVESIRRDPNTPWYTGPAKPDPEKSDLQKSPAP